MGIEIDREVFEESEYAAFDARLRDCLAALAEIAARPGFGEGAKSLGAEVELDLVDDRECPCPRNAEVLRTARDPRVTFEFDRFNLEINSTPVPFAGAPWSALGAELESTLGLLERTAQTVCAHVVSIGILPTFAREDFTRGSLTAARRYHALSAGIRRLRQASPFPINIAGEDRLELVWDDVTLEGATTSLQIHLRVPPAQFAAVYNALQIATAPALAIAANSPLFLGQRLWDETRIALFRQAVDDRSLVDGEDWRPSRVSFGHGWVRTGPVELLAECVALHEPLLPILTDEDPLAVVRAGGVPTLRELRLHSGTVWRWNRPVYDSADGGHFRIETRALPSGPTVSDMMANAAFLIGLGLAIAPEIDRWLASLTFGLARRNFYAAARRGLAAELLWPGAGSRIAPMSARDVVEHALPAARAGLVSSGMDPDDVDRHLAVIARRVETGQTGAIWQRRAFAAASRTLDPFEACRTVTRAYREASTSGLPVHAWPVP